MRRTVFIDLKQLHHDEDFQPPPLESLSILDFPPTGTLVGSAERIEVYRQRVALGLPIFHPHDSKQFSEPNTPHTASDGVRIVSIAWVATGRKSQSQND